MIFDICANWSKEYYKWSKRSYNQYYIFLYVYLFGIFLSFQDKCWGIAKLMNCLFVDLLNCGFAELLSCGVVELLDLPAYFIGVRRGC